MLTNYIKIIGRNLWRNKAFTTINIAGLAIGMATCMLILLYIQHELGYDRHHEKADRIYRVTFTGSVQGEQMREASVMPPVAEALKADYPEVGAATRLRFMGTPVVSYNQQRYRDDKLAFVDPNFGQVFDIPLAQGDPLTVLQNPHTVVVSEKTAQKYFGTENALGKVLYLENQETPFTVTGVMKNIPNHSHLKMDILASMASLPESASPSWMVSNFFTYLILPDGYDYKQLEAKLPQAIDKYMGPQMQKDMGVTLQEFRNQGNDLGLSLQPLTDIHLGHKFESDLSPSGNIQHVYMFSAIALFVLLVACINFMNLSTAVAAKRSKEVGIRKVLGSSKGGLIQQFMTESMLLTSISLSLALALVYLVLPTFSTFIDIPLSLSPIKQPWLLPGIGAVGLATGLLSGLYPAFFLSSFQPIAVLKGKLGSSKFGLRSSLVVFQFAISIILVISTLVVYQQLSFIQNKQLGYQNKQVIVLPDLGVLGNKKDVFKNKITQDSRVIHSSNSGYLPAGDSYGNNFFISPAENSAQVIKSLRYDIDEHYTTTLGMELVSGRNFSADYDADSTAIILNETAAKALGWGKDPLDHTVWHNNNDGQKTLFHVIGVVKDFHFKSFHEPITPLVMVFSTNTGNLIVKANPADIAGLLATAKAHWDPLAAGEPFVPTFLDERFEQTYKAEQKTGLLLGVFAALTIFVACMGLFGLAMFTASQRSKEIGVRKVLGASIASVVALLSSDLLKLVLIAIVLSIPLAYFAMDKWLTNFAYHIDIQWWIFAVAGLLAIAVAFLTVAGQAVKAAVADPVKSLRSE